MNFLLKIINPMLGESIPLPRKSTPGSSGWDICACIAKELILPPGNRSLIMTGFSIQVPNGFEMQIRPRSGLAIRNGITVLNSPGTIDSDYRGEVGVIIHNFSKSKFIIRPGQRIAQMVMCPVSNGSMLVTSMLSNTERGNGGFGSTESRCANEN